MQLLRCPHWKTIQTWAIHGSSTIPQQLPLHREDYSMSETQDFQRIADLRAELFEEKKTNRILEENVESLTQKLKKESEKNIVLEHDANRLLAENIKLNSDVTSRTRQLSENDLKEIEIAQTSIKLEQKLEQEKSELQRKLGNLQFLYDELQEKYASLCAVKQEFELLETKLEEAKDMPNNEIDDLFVTVLKLLIKRLE